MKSFIHPPRLITLAGLMCVAFMGHGQIYPAKSGVFILFREQITRDLDTRLMMEGRGHQQYDWPKNAHEFINRFRKAAIDFGSPTLLTDDNLNRIYTSFSEATKSDEAHLHHPTILIALGQAAYLPDAKDLRTCTVENTIGGQTQSTILSWTDQRMLSHKTMGIENDKQQDLFNQLKYIFSKETWVDSARVFKKVLGAKDSVRISPIILTTRFEDRIEMHIRDTTRVIGEYIYTIQPYDRLGLWHGSLKGVYASNYTNASAPRFLRYKSDVAEGGKHVRLSWETTSKARVRGFEIYRSPTSEGPFQRVATLSEMDTVYIDRVETTMQNFFYFIQIIDQQGYGAKSTTHFVTPLAKEKPEPPPGLLAETIHGGVKITWPPYDGFYHIKGYYVYRRVREQDEWVQLSAFIQKEGETHAYLDTSRELKAEIEYAYAVRSESTSYVLSEFSTPAYARPGKSREVVVVETFNWKHQDLGHLMLFWSDQRRHDPYVVKYHIFELDAKGEVTREVPGSPIDVHETSWQHPEKNKSAPAYVIQAEDAWGNKSVYSDPVRPKMNVSDPAPGRILMKPIATGYRLTWGLPDPSHVKSIQLYEMLEGAKPLLVKSLSNTTKSYDLTTLKRDQVKVYFITYKLQTGEETEGSEVVIISE